MYQAQREVSESRRDGSVVFYRAGEVIPSFESWTAVTRKSLLDHGIVIEVPDLPTMHGQPERPAAALSAPADPSGGIVCELCPERRFDTLRGLRLHKAKAHADG